jgi:aspartate/methionine/tyrosine aminotransferase
MGAVDIPAGETKVADAPGSVGGPKIANRIVRLGSETAFAVSAEAAAFAAEGHTVYPFHLGDLNIATPDNIVEASFKAIKDGKTGYCPNAGIPQLRAALADDLNASHKTSYAAENVAIQPGGKPVIGKFILTLMNPGDEVLYPNPGYPIYESQIEFHGGVAVPYTFREAEQGFAIDLEGLEAAITPRTRLLILNDLQNPLGAECSSDELARLAELVLRHDLTVLCDEAYFDIRYSGASKSLVSQAGMEDRCVILYTFSKKFAMTGWRLGGAVGPREVIEVISKLNVNDESCPNHFIQYGALEGLLGDQSGPLHILSLLKERRDAATPPTRPSTCSRTSPAPWPSRDSLTSRISGARYCTTPGCRSARVCTSVVPSRARANSTYVSPIRASTRPRSSRALRVSRRTSARDNFVAKHR